MTGCCDRLSGELNPCQDWYSVEDPDGVFDIKASFAPRSVLAVVLKLLALSYTNFVFFYTLWDTQERGIHFGLLTNWALCFSVVYMWLSIINSIVGVEQPLRKDNVPFKVGFQWYMFNLAIHTNILVVILYWVVEFEPGETTISFSSLSTHAGTCLVMLLEGFVVNRIPIRWFFWWGTGLLVGLAYLGWTIIHAQTDIGNPAQNNTDLLYDAVDWEDDLSGTITIFVVSIIVAGPIVQCLLFVISIYGWPIWCGSNKRRYIMDETDT